MNLNSKTLEVLKTTITCPNCGHQKEETMPQEPLFTKEYLHVRKDVHFERGMQCADCHTSIDAHGDGNIYPATVYQVEITCYDCHGTPEKYPWELPVGYGTPVTLEGGVP